MLRVIIHASFPEKDLEYDLDVPAEIPVAELTEMIVAAFEWPQEDGPYEVVVEPTGQRLAKSLAEAGLWDGTHLVFQRPA